MTKNHSKKLRWFFSIILMLLFCSFALSDEISKDLWKITELRNGLQTDYNKVYATANELLKKYSKMPEAKGRIYLGVLVVHALSGLTRPQEAIEYAKKAEQFPLNPIDKGQLYLSWGDAIQFTTPGAKGQLLRDTRRKATEKYLRSMKVLIENNLPITVPPAPEKPMSSEELATFERGMFNVPENCPPEMKKQVLKEKAAYEEREKKRKDYYKAVNQWKYQKAIINRGIGSRDLIVKLYTTLPFDTKELQKLATDILGKSEMVDDMIARIDKKNKEAI